MTQRYEELLNCRHIKTILYLRCLVWRTVGRYVCMCGEKRNGRCLSSKRFV